MWHNNPLLDTEFLKVLDAYRERETYARIIALSFQEDPIEQIEGRVTQGSINIDGASALRRTCSLSLIAEDININEYYWGIKSKFKLEIGLRNTVKNIIYNEIDGAKWGDKYPEDIIWFPQGTYAITAFNTTHNANSYTISISGKDKMCFLNGDLGGSLTASIDFGIEEYYDKKNNITTYTPIPIEKIIREAVHVYAGEPYHNIVINDLDEAAVELLEYRGDVPMYLLYEVDTGGFTNFTLNGDMQCKDAETKTIPYTLNDSKLIYDPRVDLSYDTKVTPTEVIFDEDPSQAVYTIAKVEYGQTVGYRPTDLTYAGDLISNVGESITSILDKIKKMLGEYEYFYDVEGRFIFQRKKTYIQSTWNNIVKVGDEQYVENAAHTSAAFYRFEGNNLLTSFSNNPNLANLRNDFSVWGERTGISGIKLPVHYRYAIDVKPITYNTIAIDEAAANEYNAKYPQENPEDALKPYDSIKYVNKEYKSKFTASELSNAVLEDWRELIYQMAVDHQKYSQFDWFIDKLIAANPELSTGITGYEHYYIDMLGFWRELYENAQWKEIVSSAPDQLNFWIDFLDADSELGQFSVKAVGDRVKAVNDTSVTAIYFRKVPDLIFTTYKQYNESGFADKSGYTPVFINGALENMFNISAQGKSAQDLIDELIYNHSYCIESVTIQSVPVYHLEPNVRIYVNDTTSNIQGEYIVSKLTLPLAYDGTMSITATKAPERIY